MNIFQKHVKLFAIAYQDIHSLYCIAKVSTNCTNVHNVISLNNKLLFLHKNFVTKHKVHLQLNESKNIIYRLVHKE